jgi:hypothetical protein
VIPSFWLRSSTRPPPLLLPASSISRTASHSPKGPGPKVGSKKSAIEFSVPTFAHKSCENDSSHSTVTPLALIGPVHFSISLRTR